MQISTKSRHLYVPPDHSRVVVKKFILRDDPQPDSGILMEIINTTIKWFLLNFLITIEGLKNGDSEMKQVSSVFITRQIRQS